MKKILWQYLFKEMLSPFSVSLLVLILILLLGKIMKLADILFSSQVTFASFSRVLFLALPYFLLYALPMATLLGIHLAFLRMANDKEIIALKSSGIGSHSMLGPVLVLSLSAYLLATLISVKILPDTNYRLRLSLFQMLKENSKLLLRERVFIDKFPNLVFYINNINRETQRMKKIFIQDDRKPEVKSTIFAQEGELVRGGRANDLILHLEHGVITRINDSLDTAQNIGFEDYELILETGPKAHTTLSKHPKEMSTGILLSKITKSKPGSREYIRSEIALNKRFSLPASCLVLGLIAAPLGMKVREDTRIPGFATGLAVFLVYYILFTAGKNLSEIGFIPPFLGLWLSNIVFGILGSYLWYQASRDREYIPVDSVQNLYFSSLKYLRERKWNFPWG